MSSAASTTVSSIRTRSFTAFIFLLLAVGAVPAGHTASAPAAPAILVLGDSLSAGYGVRVEQGWVALLQSRLRARGYGHRVVNASSSGETTGGALARLPRALELHRPQVVIVEVGGNDGLRGLPVPDIRSNLASIISSSQQAGARILLVAMRIPPNYGPVYTSAFEKVFGEVARQHKVALVPFPLEKVALDDALMQEDGLHPNAAAQPQLLDAIWPQLEALLARK